MVSSRLYTLRKLMDGPESPSWLRKSRPTGSRMVACLPQAAPCFRLSATPIVGSPSLSGLDEQPGGSLRYRTAATPRLRLTASGPPCAKTGPQLISPTGKFAGLWFLARHADGRGELVREKRGEYRIRAELQTVANWPRVDLLSDRAAAIVADANFISMLPSTLGVEAHRKIRR